MIDSSGRMMSLERILTKAYLTDSNYLPAKKIDPTRIDMDDIDRRMKETVHLINTRAFNLRSGSNRRDFAILIKENQCATTKVYQALERALCELVSVEDVFTRLFGLNNVPREKSKHCLELVNSVAEWMHCLVHKAQGLLHHVGHIQPQMDIENIEQILLEVKSWLLESFDLRQECVCATNFIRNDCLPILEEFGKKSKYERNHSYFSEQNSTAYLGHWTSNVERLLTSAIESPQWETLHKALQENFWLNLEFAQALHDLKESEPNMKVTSPTSGKKEAMSSLSGLRAVGGAEGWTLEELRVAVDLCIRSFMRRRFSYAPELPAFLKSSITELRISSELHSVILANLDKLGGAKYPPRLSCDACRFPVTLHDSKHESLLGKMPHRPFKVLTYTATLGSSGYLSRSESG